MYSRFHEQIAAMLKQAKLTVPKSMTYFISGSVVNQCASELGPEVVGWVFSREKPTCTRLQ